MSNSTVDVLVAGGGQVGLALAVAVKQVLPAAEVMLVDAAPRGSGARAVRASTIAAGGRKLLATLGVWDRVVADAQPVRSMTITDSRTRDLVRPVFLTFDPAAGANGEPGAHVIADSVVVAALRDRAAELGITVLHETKVVNHEPGRGAILCRTGDGTKIAARLLVAADGARSRLRALAGIGTTGRAYRQSGIVATLRHERPHEGVAEEHFLPGGPFALLPMTENRSSLVWTEPTDIAARLVKGDPFARAEELMVRAGRRLGEIDIIDGPRAFPLSLMLARSFVGPRLALAGDSAHVIHPLAGQGLNLGYRDVAALSETIVEAARIGADIGDATTLAGYDRWRRFDTLEMAAATDALNRLFANDNPALRLARDVGLGLVDRLPPVKTFLAAEARGDGKGAPRLLRGEPL